ncbi:MAG: glutamine synthetase family protein [Geminicoccaceae bacterium]
MRSRQACRNPDVIAERHDEVSPRAAWRAFTKRCPDTTTVDLILPDLAGIARGKRLTAAAFESTIDAGMTFASSVYGIDASGENVEASGLIWEEGDADRPCLVDWTTLAPAPWREGGAQVLAGLGEHDGGPFFANPRAVLTGVTKRFAELDLRPVCALELEFYLLKDRDPGGAALPGAPRAAPGQVYGLDPLDERQAFLSRLDDYCAAQGLPAKSVVSEYAPGQLEVNLGHVDVPLCAADHGFLLKRAVKAAARAEGLLATFMAKPAPKQSSSGLHVHVSLLDRDGANRFARDDRALGHAIAGLQATMAEGMLLFAPNANSFRRLRPLSYAPTAPTWGHNNRTVALRVPAGAASARRIEHRVAGADANPYLVLAAVLAGIHHGLTHALEPSAPIAGNAYAQVAPSLPLSWDHAIEALAGASVLNGYLGESFCRLYRVCRAAERDRFADVVTPTEYAWYLNTV